jgi:hypothetical protein
VIKGIGEEGIASISYNVRHMSRKSPESENEEANSFHGTLYPPTLSRRDIIAASILGVGAGLGITWVIRNSPPNHARKRDIANDINVTASTGENDPRPANIDTSFDHAITGDNPPKDNDTGYENGMRSDSKKP